MTFRLRSAAMILAGLTAMSVAPAQASDPNEPLILDGSAAIAAPTSPEMIPASAPIADPASSVDPLAPTLDEPTEPTAPVVDQTADLASKVAALRGSEPGSREIECLAVGIYFESKSEPLAGQLAVGQVIANRAASGRFAKTYCGVLFQRGQFSFVRGRSWPSVVRSSRQWHNAVAVAKIVDQKLHQSAVPRALFFHAKRVSPRWRMTRVGSVGNHVFYR